MFGTDELCDRLGGDLLLELHFRYKGKEEISYYGVVDMARYATKLETIMSHEELAKQFCDSRGYEFVSVEVAKVPGNSGY